MSKLCNIKCSQALVLSRELTYGLVYNKLYIKGVNSCQSTWINVLRELTVVSLHGLMCQGS